MPTLSIFYGIVIAVYFNEKHGPPHFHAKYGDDEALIGIDPLEVIDGGLPRGALTLTMEWAREHEGELMEAWDRCRQNLKPAKIAPLP